MFLDKELFIEVLEDIERANKYHTDLNKFFKNNKVDGYIFQPDCACSVIKILEKLFQDTEHWITKFCYDYNFGKTWKEDDTRKFGMDLSSYESLYSYLIMGR